MSKGKPCSKVKCPCKICMGPVTTRTGLQCHGACRSWIHYECTNYTPGKIKDVKAGLIKVICPCPDCTTQMPREYRTQKLQENCANRDCPANHPPKCDNKACPINAARGCQDNVSQVPSCVWPGSKCGTECKKNPPVSDWPGEKCGKVCRKHVCQAGKKSSKQSFVTPNASTCSPPPQCVGQYSDVGDTGKVSFSTVEQMCNTVGQLTQQINELMCKMREASTPRTGSGCFPRPKKNSCMHSGPKSKCPKPCFCPGNPGR